MKRLIIFLISILISITIQAETDCTKVGSISPMECESLVKLYNSTGGESWSDSPANNWNITDTPCNWNGVMCGIGGKVISIIRSNKNLIGEISSEIINFTRLQTLDLQTNQLTGLIPIELGNLTDLTSLRLYENQLEGIIPKTLGDLINLKELNIGDNQLVGEIPKTLESLVNLERLHLNNNQLSGVIPATLGNMTNLKVLSLQNNQLTGRIPNNLSILTNLQVLLLSENQLSGLIPVELANLSNLTKLSLHNNQLTGIIPIELGNLNNLTTLYLNNNFFIGRDPLVFNELINLTELDLACNQLRVDDVEIITILNKFTPGWTDAWSNMQGRSNFCPPIPIEYRLFIPSDFDTLLVSEIDTLSKDDVDNVTDKDKFHKLPSQDIAKFLVNLDNKAITPADVAELIPTGWEFNQTTGKLKAPLGKKITLTRLPPPDSLPARLKLPKNIPNLQVGFGLGGAGSSMMDGIKQSLQNSGLQDFVPSQDSNGIFKIKGTGKANGINFSFMPNNNDITQVDSSKISSLTRSKGGFYRLTTQDDIQIQFIPMPQDPVELSEMAEEVVLGDDGDVLIKLASDTRRQDDNIVSIFNSNIEQDSEENQAGIYISETKDNTKFGLQTGKVVYKDGTSQVIWPTVLSPNIFLELGYKFEGVEKVEFNSNGTFYVLYQGIEFIIVPQFKVQINTTDETVDSSIITNETGGITYSVVNEAAITTTRSNSNEIWLFDMFIEPAPDDWCITDDDTGEVFCDFDNIPY
ncbi:MAG: leucine-rich repeat domain-containing protein [Candidatus Marithrix sp.]